MTAGSISSVRKIAARLERRWRRLSYTGSIAGVAIIIAWLGLWLFRQNDGVGLLLTSVATLLTLVTFRHMRELAEHQKESLRKALEQSDRRNRELERLRHLAGTLLAGTDLDGLVKEVAQTAADPNALLAMIPKVLARLDPDLPVQDLRTMPQQVRENVFIDRFISVLSTAFACLATLLAAVGLYGVLAYTVSQRTREIGLRMALGAAPGRVRGMVLRQVGLMTMVGGVVGLAAAVALARLAQSLLFQMQGSDPFVLIGAAVALTLVALAAGFIPAHRASQVDPMRALRYE